MNESIPLIYPTHTMAFYMNGLASQY